MYAVIRAGSKQFRVSPGDVIKVDSAPKSESGKLEIADVLAVSNSQGKFGSPDNATVTAEILGEGRGDKILVFHYKRKKQYKKLQGHRQGYTALKITEISVDGEKFTAEDMPAKEAKAKKSARPARKSAAKKAAAKSETAE
jgi:large subunit ribosomal protein L21